MDNVVQFPNGTKQEAAPEQKPFVPDPGVLATIDAIRKAVERGHITAIAGVMGDGRGSFGHFQAAPNPIDIAPMVCGSVILTDILKNHFVATAPFKPV